ncbi:MAG: TetR/AcrR family transcriptional regulator [Bdellovibrionales bacterium]|nr:TetR/AcrR family transcriptional regulator [Bdellovibrionales bacterium]
MSRTEINPRKNAVQARAKDTINVIVEAATQVLEDVGVKALSTNKIVERAGISIGTLYQYFPNKESIVHHLVERLFNGMADEMLATLESLDLEGTDLRGAIDRLTEQFFARHAQKKSVFRQFLLSVVSVEHLKFMLKNDAKIADALKRKFGPYSTELRIADWDRTIFVVLYALKGIQFGVHFGATDFSPADLRAEVSALIFNHLTANRADESPRAAAPHEDPPCAP